MTRSHAQLPGAVTPASPKDGHVLVVERPDLWQAPRRNARHASTPWTAGLRLQVLETRTSGTLSWLHVSQGKREGWLPGVYLAPPPQTLAPESLHAIGSEPVDRWQGIAPEYEPQDLEPVGPALEKGKDLRLRAEAAAALKEMLAAAKAEGVTIYVVSAFRPWSYQRERYQYKLEHGGWDQQTVAQPGHSEHQLGTATDLGDGDSEHLLKESFGQTAAGRWLAAHAPRFGFAVSYTRHNRAQTGYAPEPWHYRYWGKPLAPAKHAEALGPEAAGDMETPPSASR